MPHSALREYSRRPPEVAAGLRQRRKIPSWLTTDHFHTALEAAVAIRGRPADFWEVRSPRLTSPPSLE